MKRRRNKNILIAVLFCTLVFMGIGYAARNQVLNVGTTANVTGNFDVHFESVELLEYESFVDGENKTLMQNGYGIGPTNAEAYMSAILKAPTEYVTFKAVIKNYGNIDAKITNMDVVPTADEDLRSFLSSKGKTLNDIGDYFEIEQVTGYELAPNTLIPAGETNELKIRVSFNSNATEIPDGKLEIKLRLTYTQANGSGTSQTIPDNPH